MANLSDANVDIHAYKVGKELVEYINATKEDTDYVIVYESPSLTDVDKDGNIEILGGASGRWAYSNNLEGYFDVNRVRSWLGVGADYSWLDDEKKKKEYASQANKQYKAFCKLIGAIKKTGGSVEINYTDCDPAMDWMGEGSALLEVMDDMVVFSQSFTEERLDIVKYADINDMSIYDAIDMLHGDEPADKYNTYTQECEKKGVEPKNAQQWYDEDFEWEE